MLLLCACLPLMPSRSSGLPAALRLCPSPALCLCLEAFCQVRPPACRTVPLLALSLCLSSACPCPASPALCLHLLPRPPCAACSPAFLCCRALPAAQEEVVLALDSGLAASAALAAGADRETAEALHAMEVLSLEGSGRGRALLRPNLSTAGMVQPY